MIITKFQKIGRILFNKNLYRYFLYNLFHVQHLKLAIIVCGCPRSGTTLLMSILDAHPEIHVIPFETSVLQARPLKKRIFKNTYLHNLFCRWQITLYLFSGKIKTTANRWCEKTPLNILNVESIEKMYKGRVMFINIVRDGRAVVSSKHSRYGYMVSPDLWYQCVMEGKRHTHKTNFLTIRYEDLVNSPNEALSTIQQFLQLKNGFSDRWFEQTSIRGSIINLVSGKSEGSLIVKPIDKSSLNAWSKSASPWLSDFINSSKCMELNKELNY